jgi:hypothetical protein
MDIWPLLSESADAASPHEAFYYYQMDQLQAVRSGHWKLHLELEDKKRNWGAGEGAVPLRLFHLMKDLGEKNDVAAQNPAVVTRLLELAEKARTDLGDLDRPGKNQRPAGWVESPKPLT